MTPNNDMAKCTGQDTDAKHICAYREQCLRYVRPSGDRQVWAEFWRTGDYCNHYLSLPKL